jgi:hypothetical protein
MSDVPQQLVFAQQSLAATGGAKQRNDLVVLNSSDFSDSGVVVGQGGNFNNLRLSYSLADSAAKVVTDNLHIAVEQLYFKNISSSVALQKSMNQLVIDPQSGAVREGYPAFALGNLNDIVPSIQADINVLKQTLGIEVQQTASLQSILGYVSIALVILLLILVVVLFVRFSRLNKDPSPFNAIPSRDAANASQAPQAPGFNAPAFSPGFNAPAFSPGFNAAGTPFNAPAFTDFGAPTGFVPPSFTGMYSMPRLRR